MEPEAGDVVTVAVRQHGRSETFHGVTVATVPDRDRFTFFAAGRLHEARPEQIVTYEAAQLSTPQ